MNFKTKFNVGDHVYFMSYNSVQKDRIAAINIFTNTEIDLVNGKFLAEVEYIFDRGYSTISFPYERKSAHHFIIPQSHVFETKEELLKSL